MSRSDTVRAGRRRFLLALGALTAAASACSLAAPAEEARGPEATSSAPATATATATAVATPTAAPSPAPSLTPTREPTPAPTALPAPSATPSATPLPAAAPLEIVQPARPDAAAFAGYALEMRRLAVESGDQAYGAIIMREARVVGLGPSRVVVGRDATAHAEMEAIRDASRRLRSADLSGCVIYSTSRPCPMCETTAYYARLARMVVGANATDAGAPRYGAC